MYEQQDFEELESEIYEDPEDMVDRIFEKLQKAITLYVFWAKIFLEGEDSHKLKEPILEYFNAEFDFLVSYMMVRADEVDGGLTELKGSIRRWSKPPCIDQSKNPE